MSLFLSRLTDLPSGALAKTLGIVRTCLLDYKLLFDLHCEDDSVGFEMKMGQTARFLLKMGGRRHEHDTIFLRAHECPMCVARLSLQDDLLVCSTSRYSQECSRMLAELDAFEKSST